MSLYIIKKMKLTKKFIYKFLVGIALFSVVITVVIVLLNIKVTTRQGINFQVQTIRIPLYLKMIDFFDRHYNYKQLVQRIIKNEQDKQKRVMKIFSWTYHNIRKQPENLLIIDDHVWHIIVRGYGLSDQSCDVFATLCNYAGIDAFYASVFTKDMNRKIRLSFVRLHNRWHVFDPYNGVYFINNAGVLVDTNEIKKGNYRLEYLGTPKETVLDYRDYFDNLPDVKEVGLRRVKIQSPFKRLLYELRK